MAHCWLYIYENRERRQIYIGIADQMDRVFEDHNSDAMELLSADGTEIIQTVLPFSSRADARKAEAIGLFADEGVAVGAGRSPGRGRGLPGWKFLHDRPKEDLDVASPYFHDPRSDHVLRSR